MAGRTAWVLGDQLSRRNPAIEGADRVLIVESAAKLRAGRPHRQRLHLFLSAMRHFAAEIGGADGPEVDYRRADSLRAGLEAHTRRHRPDEVVMLAPSSITALRWANTLERIEIIPGTLFLTRPEEFADWAAGRKRPRMEDFYRWQRRRLGVLMAGGKPEGGRWNYDAENRRPPPRDLRPPRPYKPREDEIDTAVRDDLDRLRLDTFGTDGPRRWPATRAEARRALRSFVERRLADFGPWQDAMLHGERFMWHGLLSSSLNLGLLSPAECVRAAVRAYRDGAAPLASVEGFVRQIIGWREYVHGLHWVAAGRRKANALRAREAVPEVLWTGETEMRCLADATEGVREVGYAHHIERLMVFGNLMLLLGCRPQACLDWFRDCFIDANEWVMDANVLGMATFADGGRVATKPYAASGRYIDRMSDHCSGCPYDPGERTGEDACPYTTLYWDFLARNRERLAGNRRMALAYRNLDRIPADERRALRRRAGALRRRFDA